MYRILSLIFIFIVCNVAQGANYNSAKYSAEELQKKPTTQLIKESLSYIGNDSMIPRMLAGCNVVYNRYLDNPQDKSSRKAATEALQAMGNHYMCRDIDYRKAYKNLWLAKQIADEDENYFALSTIYNSLANLYYFSSDNDSEKEAMASEFLSKAAQAAMKSNNEIALASITENIAIISATNLKWGAFAHIIPQLISYRYKKNTAAGHQSQALLQAVKYLLEKKYSDAENTLLALEQNIAKYGYSERSVYTINLLLIKVYRNSNQLPKAINLIKSMLKEVKNKGNIDYELTLYQHLANIYNELGQNDSSEYYNHKLRALKESMENDNGYKAVRELDFTTEIERINAEVEQLSIKNQEERRVRIIVIACCVVLTVLLLSLLWMHINLKRTHQRLYRKSEEQMLREQQHRLIRQQSKQDNDLATTSPSSISDIDPEHMEAMRRVYSRILIIMEENREIFDNNFSIGDLASLAKETVRTVSRAINVCHKTNFHGLLNEYRIREVIRLMHTPDARNYTIESLAEQAGFKSRTSFSSLFKRTTGLTPSEYMRMALKESTS